MLKKITSKIKPIIFISFPIVYLFMNWYYNTKKIVYIANIRLTDLYIVSKTFYVLLGMFFIIGIIEIIEVISNGNK